MKPTATEDTVPQRMLHSTHEWRHVAVFVPSAPGSVRCTVYRGCATLVDEHVSRREAIVRWKQLLTAGWQRTQLRERVKRQVPVPFSAVVRGEA